MKIVLHGLLRDRFGPSFEIHTNTPAEAIEGLSRQIPSWPRELAIDCIGFDTEEKLRATTDKAEIHLMPRMFGGGGKWGKIIIGAALMAVAIAGALPTGGLSLGAGLAITNGMVFMMGASLMLAGVSELFLRAPTSDKSADPPASKYLGNGKNTTAIGTLITMAWGRIKLAGQWLSVQVDSNDLVTTSFPATTS